MRDAISCFGRNRLLRPPTACHPENDPMPQTIAAIYRYPVKGLSPEPLGSVALTPGKCLPQDRRFAIALPSTRFDPERPEWLSKTHFVMLMRDEQLAELTTRFDAEADLLTIERDRKSTRLNSSHSQISYAVFCFKKKTIYIIYD